MLTTVQADLGHEQGAVCGEVLEPREVGVVALGFFEIDVIGVEVHRRDPQILGRRIVDIRDQGIRILVVHGVAHALEEPLDTSRAVPAHDARWDLIPDSEPKHGGVSRAGADRATDPLLDGPCDTWQLQEGDVLLPRHTDEDIQVMSRRRIEHPWLRNVVQPNGVHAVLGHLPEVVLCRRGVVSVVPGCPAREWPVRHALDQQFLVADVEELAIDPRPVTFVWRRRRGA